MIALIFLYFCCVMTRNFNYWLLFGLLSWSSNFRTLELFLICSPVEVRNPVSEAFWNSVQPPKHITYLLYMLAILSFAKRQACVKGKSSVSWAGEASGMGLASVTSVVEVRTWPGWYSLISFQIWTILQMDSKRILLFSQASSEWEQRSKSPSYCNNVAIVESLGTKRTQYCQ